MSGSSELRLITQPGNTSNYATIGYTKTADSSTGILKMSGESKTYVYGAGMYIGQIDTAAGTGTAAAS